MRILGLSVLISVAFLGCSKDDNNSNPSKFNWTEDIILKSGSPTTPIKQSTEEIMKELLPDFNTSMLLCPDKIWPNYSWAQYNVLLLDGSNDVHLWDGSTGTSSKIEKSKVPAQSYYGLFDFFPWENNEDAVSLYPTIYGDAYSHSVDSIFQIAIHEGFHDLGQKNWQQGGGSRGTAYPLVVNSRLYRKKLFDRLYEYFQAGGTDKKSLQAAKFWFDKWQVEFPDEVLSTTDGYEGTARYVEYMATAVSKLGCTATNEELHKELLAFLPTQNYSAYLSPKSTLDSEGYTLGSLGGFILTLIDKNSLWFDEMKSAKTPLDILLADVVAEPDLVSTELKLEYEQVIATENQALYQLFGKDLGFVGKKEYVRVFLSGQFASFSPHGFYLPTALPNTSVIPLASDLSMTVSNGTAVVLRENSVMYEFPEIPCSNKSGFLTVLIPAQDIVYENGSAKMSSNLVQGNYPSDVLQDTDGFTWYCPPQK